jgi:hypothetical protein
MANSGLVDRADLEQEEDFELRPVRKNVGKVGTFPVMQGNNGS